MSVCSDHKNMYIKKDKNVQLCNWPLSIGAFRDQCKQTMITKHSNKHINSVKNPNWQEADQLAIDKHS